MNYGDQIVHYLQNFLHAKLSDKIFWIFFQGNLFDSNYLIIISKIIDHSDFVFENQKLSLGVSIGVASYPYNASDMTQLLAFADERMYENKVSKGNSR